MQFDLWLQGKLVVCAAIEQTFSSPLWCCAQCGALLDAPGRKFSDSGENSSLHNSVVSKLYDDYVPLTEPERAELVGRRRIIDMIRGNSDSETTEFMITKPFGGPQAPSQGGNQAWDDEAWKTVWAYCISEQLKRSGGVLQHARHSWKIETAADRCIVVRRVS
jgi:hypothetical protein